MSGYKLYFPNRVGDDQEIVITTNSRLFSPHGLDRGTELMLSLAARENLCLQGDEVLDLGCGAGVVGIWACLRGAQVTCVDIDPLAIDLAKENFAINHLAQPYFFCSNGLAFRLGCVSLPGYDLILSNPPYHTDFSVAKGFIEDGFTALKPNGKMLLVVKRALWYQNKVKAIFGGYKLWQEDGYTIILAEKRSAKPAFVAQKRAKKERIREEREQNKLLIKKKRSPKKRG